MGQNLRIAGSSNGRTAAFEAVYLGSIPSPATGMILDFYIFIVALGLCVMYFFLSCSLAHFFEWEKPNFQIRRSLRSLGLIFLTAGVVFIAMNLVDDRQLANRIEHAFGGGFLAFLMCYLVARDMGRPITRFQFFVLGFLVVTALGVANEIFEFFAQEYYGIILAKNLDDTWLDLISNTVGAFIGAAIFVPMLNAKK